MDRFKFRYWYTKENRYINTQCDCLAIKNTILYSLIGKPNKNGWFETDIEKAYNDFELIPEQCTGLSDKNGKLIYEGDIIRFCLNTRGYVLAYERAVVWDNESASFMIVSNLDQVKPRTKRQMPNIKTHNIEIIGNIHEQKDNK